MLEVPLGRLQREGTVAIDARIPPDDPMWAGMTPSWATSVHASFQVSLAGSGEVFARGHVHGQLAQECRRCLEPLERMFDEDFTLVFVDEGEIEEEEEERGEAHVLQPTDSEVDLSGAIREEVFLSIEPYVVCDPECQGLCPGCGANLNERACTCSGRELDPRWEPLRKLKEK